METQFIQAPSAELRVLDLGALRRIFVKGTAVHNGQKTSAIETIDTPYCEFKYLMLGMGLTMFKILTGSPGRPILWLNTSIHRQ